MTLTRHDLAACFVPDPSGPSRRVLVKEPGLTILHLTMGPGQAMPVHNHPGCTVTIQCMAGEACVVLEGASYPLKTHELFSFSGELMVRPCNESDEPAAVLITLAEVTDRAA
ncbi:MAG: cupin domain-containing protein [Trueperaceae bacterium]|nr:hypothetical protein [Truepera sp.]HRN19032.1 hypothetical protein [Trueperaceae bacterium]HRQ10323.1 hypothetical protein [Trueperaceae bacterium]